jgi:hypothetical protein
VEQTDPKTPTVVGIYISGEDNADLGKEDFKKSSVIANYSRTIAEMMQVVRTGKAWDASSKLDAQALAATKKITDFQAKLVKITPDQEALTDLTVITPKPGKNRALTILRDLSMS